MKKYPKKSKTHRNTDDFYFGEYGDIPLAISSSTLHTTSPSDDTLHYHNNSYEFYICISGKGILEVEGEKIELTSNEIIMVEPQEKHKIFYATETPFSYFAIATQKNKNDKITLE